MLFQGTYNTFYMFSFMDGYQISHVVKYDTRS